MQYAKAMGMNVVLIDVGDDKLELAKKLGADLVVNAKNQKRRKKSVECMGHWLPQFLQ